MLSICIPVYEYDVASLVSDLRQQIDDLEEMVEIVLIDDASSEDFRKINSAIEGVKYVQLEENVGRAVIRNTFLDHVQFDYLIFLDTDSIIIEKDFLITYLEAIRDGEKVICGGRLYPDTIGDNNRMLRWKYGKERESKPASERSKHPHQSFMTNNFLIHKKVLKEVRFNEELKGYGHEDTLFGFELKKRKISIHHIDNPILNGDIETNEEFLKKTEEGIHSLIKVLKLVNFDQQFIQSVQLLDFYYSKKWMMPLIKLWFFIRKKGLRKSLIAGEATVRAFNFYKLGFFTENIKSSIIR